MIQNRKTKLKRKLQQEFGYLKKDIFDFDLIEKYFRKKEKPAGSQTITDKTCNDIDFQELFMFLDRTNSRVGQQYLYNKLRTLPSDPVSAKPDSELLREMEENEDFRLEIQSLLHRLNDKEAAYISTIFQDDNITPPRWYFIVPLLSFANVLSLILGFFEPVFFMVLIFLSMVNIVIHFWNKKNLYNYYSSIPQLSKMNTVAHELVKYPQLVARRPEIKTAVATFNKMSKGLSVFHLDAGIQSDQQIIFWALMEIIKIIFLIEPLFLFETLKRIDNRGNEIEQVFEFIGEMDMLVSVASLRHGLPYYCQPDIHTTNRSMTALEVYHPLIENCVTNDLRLHEKSILLTGSNMSGKTSFIRTIAINVITGMTINTCFARQFSMPVLQLYSAIRISDDLTNDRSYYFEEVLSIKDMIDKRNDGICNLFLLDEIFKGTNTVERIAAGKAVLSSLHSGNNIVFVSTHDIELADLLSNEYDLYHFSEIVQNKTVDFDYKLKEGKLKNRNAIRILQINNYPEKLIEEAMQIAEKLDKIRINQQTDAQQS